MGLVLVVALAAGSIGIAVKVLWPSSARWSDGSEHGLWQAVYDGYGRTTGSDQDVLLSPRRPASADPNDTHAALVVTRRKYTDMVATVSVRTEEQLRPTSKNPWEVGWVLWHFTDRQHFYGLTLKPNGWELSKQDPRYPGSQKFLASGHTPRFSVGRWHTVRIVQVGDVLVISADGKMLVRYQDKTDPYLRGSIGLYTEDAKARFKKLTVDGVVPGEIPPPAETVATKVRG